MPDDDKPDSSSKRDALVHNERTKLRATALNSIGIASIVAGFITPLAAIAFGVPGTAAHGVGTAALAAVAFFAIGVSLHLLAIRSLGGLKE